MTQADDKLKKLAEERKKENPFEQIDEMEKELNLDESPETESDTSAPNNSVDNNLLRHEDSEVKQDFAKAQIFDNQIT